ncbi:MAG: sigma-70 family RNA polymerase sigma factor [Archangium sp.]|nr:sigma-70 family RNA polymerase sigma factor [Archangium sp.]
MTDVLAAAQAGNKQAFEQLVAPYRRELRAHCYRMSGSTHDAEDLLQDSLVKAWKGLGGFEGRSSLRGWLYRVATSACLNALEAKKNRALPSDLSGASEPSASVVSSMQPNPEVPWLEPCPDEWIEAEEQSPEARYSRRQSVSLAFLTALQRLPPRQRAVLLLRDVLGWQASECAELLELSVAAVNSALQRARATLEESRAVRPVAPDDETTRSLLKKYIAAWERSDVGMLVQLLKEDAVLTMPPMPVWFSGAANIGASLSAMVLVPGSAGTYRVELTAMNGQPALTMFRDGVKAAVHVLTLDGDRIARLDAFLEPAAN